MRIVGLFFFAAVCLALGWQVLSIDPVEARARAEAEQRRMASVLGILGALQEDDRFEFRNIVIGLSDPDERTDFRAQLLQEGRQVPVFGQMSSDCDARIEFASCWKLVHLEADGRVVDLNIRPQVIAQHVTPATVAEPAAPAELAEASTAGRDATPEPVVQETLATADATPPPTHRVARARINARSGPGTGNPVITRLVEGSRLSLLQARDGWGHFVVLDGDDRGAEVWAALRILDPI